MESAGRANARETGVTVIGIRLSLYPTATAEEWGRELEYQVESWPGAIAGGRLGVGV